MTSAHKIREEALEEAESTRVKLAELEIWANSLADQDAAKEALECADKALEAFCRLSGQYYDGYNDQVTFRAEIPIGWVRCAMKAREAIRALAFVPPKEE